MKLLTKYLIMILIMPLLTFCSNKDENIGVKKKRIPVNASERAQQAVDKGGGLLDALNKKGSTTFDFATSNPLWRATIDSLQDIPLANVDYSGGVIVTDWYSKGGSESIKINVNFISSELKTSSIVLNTFKKTCNPNSGCKIEKLNNEFSYKLKEKIFAKARQIEIEKKQKTK